jgi:hypothetical protein
MPRPPLSLALHLVLAASVDGASRLGLLSSLNRAVTPSPADPLAPAGPLALAGPPAPALTAAVATPPQVQSRTGTRRGSRARDERLGQPLATVLTMPRVIPMPRPRRAPGTEHDPDPFAA